MNRRTLLFVINSDTSNDQIAEVAEAAAQRQDHLTCLLLGSSPTLPMYAYGVPPYGGMNVPDKWGVLVQDAQRDQKERVDAIKAVLAKSDVSGEVQSALCVTMDIKHRVARSARVCDEALIAPNLRDTPDILREATYGVLYHSPIGLRLNGAAPLNAARVFVAWDSSEAAASAVHAALPYLKEAEEVVIGCIDPVSSPERNGQDPGADVAAWLSHHGCKVTVSQFPSGGREVAACLQDRAKEFGADLVVMGAYGHTRLVEAVFGGTTRSMMEQVELPVILAH